MLLGHPVAHSLSPRFQNAALQAAGIPLQYEAVDVAPASLAAQVAVLRAEGASGNVTIPHKEEMAALVDRCSPLATRVGAVNTFAVRDGVLFGENTDVLGVERALEALFDAPSGAPTLHALQGGACAVIGAGGSAAAALVALERMGAGEIRVWGRTGDRARRLRERLQIDAVVHQDLDAACRGAALVINATPAGMRDDTMPVAPTALTASTRALDLVYRAGETAWVHACRARGLVAHDGLRMLVEQGAAAFSFWFGRAPSREAMWSALEPR